MRPARSSERTELAPAMRSSWPTGDAAFLLRCPAIRTLHAARKGRKIIDVLLLPHDSLDLGRHLLPAELDK